MTDVRVVVVGAGKMGALHARVFAAAPGAHLAGVLDVDCAAADRVARAHGAPVLRTLDEAIDCADLVVVATPTALHFAHARAALVAGRAALVEKPLAASTAEARALCDASRDGRATLLVGHSERFNPVVRALVELTRGDAIRAIGTRRTALAPADDLCVNLAVHDIDLVAVLARAPAKLVSASGGADEADLVLRAAGTAARAHVACGAPRRVRAIRVDTAATTFTGDLVAHRLTRNDDDVPLDPDEPIALQARAALAALRRAPSPIASGRDGLHAVEIAELATARLTDALRIPAAE